MFKIYHCESDMHGGSLEIMSPVPFRKGIDLVAELIPLLCRRKFGGRHVNFLIAGDGPKRILIEEVIEKYKLQRRLVCSRFISDGFCFSKSIIFWFS